MKLDQDLHEYTTTLNSGAVQVYLNISLPSWVERLDSVWFDGANVTSILDQQILQALSMEAERAYSGDIRE